MSTPELPIVTAAFRYPTVGGVLVFAPTCHGKLPHAARLRARRAEAIDDFARHLRAPGTLSVYFEFHLQPLIDQSASRSTPAPPGEPRSQ